MMDSVTANNPPRFEAIALTDESTVVAEFIRGSEVRDEHYQSEAQLEQDFIRRLKDQQYEYIKINDETQLISNLRRQLENLNNIRFSDNDWNDFFNKILARPNANILDKTQLIQNDYVQVFPLEGQDKNIYLIDKQHIHNNRLQVINQYEVKANAEQGIRASRYDVTILVNGLPLVHVELKRRGVDLREAFNQISRYQRDSFSAGSRLFEYIQIFVISNGTQSKYYSNTTRKEHVDKQSSAYNKENNAGSFYFANWWTDGRNNIISDLTDFTKTFFSRHTLLNILTRYCVFDKEQKLKVMRPYQIAASEAILQRIKTATLNNQLGTIEAGGYIWHTTGSGKTLTSFKTAQLACQMSEVEKVLFVVDRKDLDHQTISEYKKFGANSVNATKDAHALKQQLEQNSTRIVVTTIQKLSNFVKKHNKHPIYNAHVAIIFDECHRSQFGGMHRAITDKFRRYHLFGFTGTPIFSQNAITYNKQPKSIKEKTSLAKTTEELFGRRLHIYTIVNAIGDKTVLPFKIDYIRTIKAAESIDDKKVPSIDTEQALLAPQRIEKIVSYILQNFNSKTRRNKAYKGFNSLLATASIEAAKRYYLEFKRQQQHLPPEKRLNIALIYSFAPNEDPSEESLSAEGLEKSDRDFLDDAIKDYNLIFNERFSSNKGGFENYYADLTKKLKDKELDIVIVINMFLTGFDAKTLNTLWVDKNLKMHSLIQAYSRTNRILNAVKVYGNIVTFRNLEQETNEALLLFGSPDATNTAVVPPYAYHYKLYKKYIDELLGKFALKLFPLASETDKKAFITLFNHVLKSLNILSAFDEFSGNEILKESEYQDYLTNYNDLYKEFREKESSEKEDIKDDLVFEMELVKQVEVNVDYILLLIEQYITAKNSAESEKIRASISRNINASPSLRSKKDLIEQFIQSVSFAAPIDEQWTAFITQKRNTELESLILQEELKAKETRRFMQRAFRNGELKTAGQAVSKLLPNISRLTENNRYILTKQRVLDKLDAFFKRFFGLG